jgi:formate dehydrogenase (coenzyme F420) alpha subunit
MEIVKSYCKICNCRCGIIAQVEGGRIVQVKGDPDCEKNEGRLCVKGRAMLELLYDADRLLHPMVSENQQWKAVSWDDALDRIAERLQALKRQFGPESVAFYRGMAVYSVLPMISLQRFANLYGSPNLASNAALCVGSKIIANRYTFGKGVSPCSDFRNSKCILLMGTNPAITGMHRSIRVMSDILKAKKDGAKLIVIDPKKTETGSQADIYTPIRPGTDAAFVLSLIHVIIENKLYDQEFVSKYTYGFEELQKTIKGYAPADVEKITWVDRERIEQIAFTFATHKPACADRREGILHHENGTQTCRAINILNAITGNIDVRGGIKLNTNLFDRTNPLYNPLTLKERFSSKRLSISAANPITQDIPTDLIKAVLHEEPYPIKALFVVGSNPLLAWPNTNVVSKALEKLDFLVMIDIYRNETARFADIILPAATFLEKTDLQVPDMGIPSILQLQQKIIDPLGESRSEFAIMKGLAQRIGFAEDFNESEEECLDKILAPWGFSTDGLKENGSGVVFDPRPIGFYHRHPYPTDTGKVELFSNTLDELGYNPLPEFEEPSESPIATPDLAKHYPLILVSGNRVPTSYLSFLHNLPALHSKTPRNWVEIHPDTASARSVQEGNWVIVSSPRGEIRLEVKINPSVDPRVVLIPYGWGHDGSGSWQLANADPGENVNLLTDHGSIDPMSGTPNFKSLLCEVRKSS